MPRGWPQQRRYSGGKAPNATARGDAVQAGLGRAPRGMKARTNQLFDIARDRSTARFHGNIMGRVEGALSIFDPNLRGGPGVPPELQGVLDDIGKPWHAQRRSGAEHPQPLGRDRRSGVGGGQQAAFLGGWRAVSNAIEEEMSDPRWMAAVAQRTGHGRGVGPAIVPGAATGAILRTDKFGAP